MQLAALNWWQIANALIENRTGGTWPNSRLLVQLEAMNNVTSTSTDSRLFGQVDHCRIVRDSGVIEVIMVLRGENGTAAFSGKSRNRDGLARSPSISGSFLWVHDWIPLERPYPDWLYDWLVISYACFSSGKSTPCWIPYLFRPESRRAARYRIMFGKTHSFLPTRNGMVPNTAHILLHLATAFNRLFSSWSCSI
jgi:hypothetical protein